jgi:Flp pilus assembly pilin Flp
MNPLKSLKSFESPLIIYLTAMFRVRLHRARTAPTRGASAVEWVIITAIIAGVALGLATLIQNLVSQKSADIQKGFGGGGAGGAGNGGGG